MLPGRAVEDAQGMLSSLARPLLSKEDRRQGSGQGLMALNDGPVEGAAGAAQAQAERGGSQAPV